MSRHLRVPSRSQFTSKNVWQRLSEYALQSDSQMDREIQPTAGDILIISHWDVVFDVVRVGNEVIERTASKQTALVVAFSSTRPPSRVWFVEVGGRPLLMDPPTT